MTTTRVVRTMRSLDGTGSGAVRMEDRYDTDIDDLWSALTVPQRLARWSRAAGTVSGGSTCAKPRIGCW